MPILAFFLLRDARLLCDLVLRVLPRGRLRSRGVLFLGELNETLAAYIRPDVSSALEPSLQRHQVQFAGRQDHGPARRRWATTFRSPSADDGPGIPERDLDRVFEGFCQLHDADARGLGLGLYISRAIVQAHGGRIWATSRPGAGSTFYFTVPGRLRRDRPRVRPMASPAPPRPDPGLRVSAQSAGRRRNLRSSVAGSQLERNKRLDPARTARPR